MNTSSSRTVRNRLAHVSRTAVMSIMLVFAVGIGVGLDRLLIETGVVGAATQFTSSDEFTVLEETYDAIRNNYVLEEEISDEELIYGASQGMIEALGDEGHSVFLDPEEARQFEESSRGELVGIGIQIDITGELPVVITPLQDSPAFEAGILPGDAILEVDGTSLEGMDPSEAADLITGEEGTDVTIVLQHKGEEDTFEVTITRQRINIDPVSWAMLPNGIMWLELSQFSSGATEGIQEAIRAAEELGATGIILDLRNNPGGLVFEAMGVASQFLPDGTPLYQEVDAEGNANVVETVGSNGVYQDGPLVVLVNEYSASSSEIVASSIEEAGRAPLIGEQTIGTGTVLLPFEVGDEGALAVLGIELWLTGEGEEIYKVGVEPTIEVEMDPETTPALSIIYTAEPDDQEIDQATFDSIEDNQLHAAWEHITGGTIATPESD